MGVSGYQKHNPADNNDGPFKDGERVAEEAARLAVQTKRDHAREQLQRVKAQEEMVGPLHENAEFRRDAGWHVHRHENTICKDHDQHEVINCRRIDEPQARAPWLLMHG